MAAAPFASMKPRDWECVEPTDLENRTRTTQDPDDPRGCPAGKVATASETMPTRKKVRVAVDAIKQMFHFVGGMRRAKGP